MGGRGKSTPPAGLAHASFVQFTQWQQDGRDVIFVIGGADGLEAGLKAKADLMLRISSLTLPHGMVRVILAEQIYRAWTITQNHPYHRI